MNPADPPEVIELFEAIASLRGDAESFDGPIYRSAAVRYANEADFLTGDGAASYGGRWNPIGQRAVYGSLDVITATHEAYQEFARYGFAGPIKPRVMAGIQANLRRVLNLTNQSVRRRLGFTLTALLEEDWRGIQAAGSESWTQAIGRGCALAGFEGLRVRSARWRKGENLAIFPDQIKAPSALTLISGDQLPPHPDDCPA